MVKYHSVRRIAQFRPYLITSTIWDNISVVIGELKVSLFYRSMSEINDAEFTAEFTEVSMLDCGGFLYRENIQAQSSISTIEYYIKAEDKMGNISYDPPDAPDSVFSFLRVEEVSRSSSGIPLSVSTVSSFVPV